MGHLTPIAPAPNPSEQLCETWVHPSGQQVVVYRLGRIGQVYFKSDLIGNYRSEQSRHPVRYRNAVRAAHDQLHAAGCVLVEVS
ncbi:MAG: hypothetical protein AB7S38_28690 [Vulcanimicrobiota bacterium]